MEVRWCIKRMWDVESGDVVRGGISAEMDGGGVILGGGGAVGVGGGGVALGGWAVVVWVGARVEVGAGVGLGGCGGTWEAVVGEGVGLGEVAGVVGEEVGEDEFSWELVAFKIEGRRVGVGVWV